MISYFQREYIKTGLFDKKYSRYLQTSFNIRHDCDYEDFFIVAKEDAETQYANAAELTKAINQYLETK